jgi:hypothetical protein
LIRHRRVFAFESSRVASFPDCCVVCYFMHCLRLSHGHGLTHHHAAAPKFKSFVRAAGSAIVEHAKAMISAAQWQTQSGHRLTRPATEVEKAGAWELRAACLRGTKPQAQAEALAQALPPCAFVCLFFVLLLLFVCLSVCVCLSSGWLYLWFSLLFSRWSSLVSLSFSRTLLVPKLQA